jgi:serine/threonine protein kinase
MAKVLMSGIAALHSQAIVHSDLKPANIMLIRDKSIIAGYRLRIIDMDFSLLADKEAPWHGDRGYFGTPGYLSPEHLRGDVPQTASDVFTLGLMLHELLGRGHPYSFEDEKQYHSAVLTHSAKPINLFGSLAKLPNARQIQEAVHHCLNPHPRSRPSSMSVNMALNGKDAHAPLDLPPAADTNSIKPTPDKLPEVKPGINGRLVLRSEAGAEKVFNVETPIGRHLVRSFGDDYKFFDELQFTLSKDKDGWFVTPNPTAKNATVLNGRRIATTTRLTEGDVLAVGSVAKRIIKLPMTVYFKSTV